MSVNSADKPGSTALVSAPASNYKYATEFGYVAGCPFNATAAFTESSFRIVKSDLKHPENFVPVARLAPNRRLEADPMTTCKSWALSMFETKEQLSGHILKMEKYSPRWRLRVGDHGARLKLTSLDGRRTTASRDGHFSFFEYALFDGALATLEHFPIFAS